VLGRSLSGPVVANEIAKEWGRKNGERARAHPRDTVMHPGTSFLIAQEIALVRKHRLRRDRKRRERIKAMGRGLQ